MSEFEMITQYFSQLSPERSDTILGIGDDTALISVPGGDRLVTTILQWQSDIDYNIDEPASTTATQFFLQAISQIEALSTTPKWMTLSLSFKHLNKPWLLDFSKELGHLTLQHNIQLIGGDTTRGTDTLRIFLMGSKQVL